MLRSFVNPNLDKAARAINEVGERAMHLEGTQEPAVRYQRMITDMLFTICQLHPTMLDSGASATLDDSPEFFVGNELFIYGADSTFSANFCGMLLDKRQDEIQAVTAGAGAHD